MEAFRSLDYVSFTLKEATVGQVVTRLGIEVQPLEHGRFNYRKCATNEDRTVWVMWDGATMGMGVHVELTGRGCRLLEGDGFDWIEWAKKWRAWGAEFSRVDLALDEVSGTVQFEQVYHQVRDGVAMRRGRNWQIIENHKDTEVNRTLYVGSRQSETMLRCYDKGLQQKEGRYWLRFEFEYKGDRAESFVSALIESGWDHAVGSVRSVIEFKDASHDTKDITRQRAAKWWVELVATAKTRLKGLVKPTKTLAEVKSWISKQVSSAFALVTDDLGGDSDELVLYCSELIIQGKAKWKKRHFEILNAPKPVLAV